MGSTVSPRALILNAGASDMANQEDPNRSFLLIAEWEQWRVTNWDRSLDRSGNINVFLRVRQGKAVPVGQCTSKCRKAHNRRCQLREGHRPVFHRSGPYAWIDNGIEQVPLRFGDR